MSATVSTQPSCLELPLKVCAGKTCDHFLKALEQSIRESHVGQNLVGSLACKAHAAVEGVEAERLLLHFQFNRFHVISFAKRFQGVQKNQILVFTIF